MGARAVAGRSLRPCAAGMGRLIGRMSSSGVPAGGVRAVGGLTMSMSVRARAASAAGVSR